jgi:hypothetical protein
MAYHDHFKLADDLINHLDGIIGNVSDPFISSRYVGFVAVAGTTVYELAIKEIFLKFSEKKHKVFGNFANSFFERLNGRIKTSELRNYLSRFGDRYVERYKKLEKKMENDFLRKQGKSVLSSYNNIIEWRNQFAHQGQIPTTPSYHEVTSAYRIGKEIIHCLAKVMRR